MLSDAIEIITGRAPQKFAEYLATNFSADIPTEK